MPYIGQSLTEGTRREYSYVATAGQTVFPAVYTVGAVDVHQNGILLPPSDYTATDGTTVVFATGCAVNDEVVIHCHNTFSVADTYTKSASDDRFVNASGDTMTGALRVGPATQAYGYGSGYVAAFNSGGGQTYISIARGGATNDSQGLILGEDASNSYILQRENKSFIIGTNDTNRVYVNGAGIVTTPFQPSFRAYDGSGANGNFTTFASTEHNVGGHWNGANGRFTAPIGGRYIFTYNGLHRDTPTSYVRVLFAVNGVITTRYGDTLVNEEIPYRSVALCQILWLNSGDYVQLYNEGNNTYDLQYNSFSGMLLG